jgi:hypothetical protein
MMIPLNEIATAAVMMKDNKVYEVGQHAYGAILSCIEEGSEDDL